MENKIEVENEQYIGTALLIARQADDMLADIDNQKSNDPNAERHICHNACKLLAKHHDIYNMVADIYFTPEHTGLPLGSCKHLKKDNAKYWNDGLLIDGEIDTASATKRNMMRTLYHEKISLYDAMMKKYGITQDEANADMMLAQLSVADQVGI